jgi:hypothetical protein
MLVNFVQWKGQVEKSSDKQVQYLDEMLEKVLLLLLLLYIYKLRRG